MWKLIASHIQRGRSNGPERACLQVLEKSSEQSDVARRLSPRGLANERSNHDFRLQREPAETGHSQSAGTPKKLHPVFGERETFSGGEDGQ